MEILKNFLNFWLKLIVVSITASYYSFIEWNNFVVPVLGIGKESTNFIPWIGSIMVIYLLLIRFSNSYLLPNWKSYFVNNIILGAFVFFTLF